MRKTKLWFKKVGWYLLGEVPIQESLEAYEDFKANNIKIRAHTKSVCLDGCILARWGVPDDEHVSIKFIHRNKLMLSVNSNTTTAVAFFPPDELMEFLYAYNVTYDVLERIYE